MCGLDFVRVADRDALVERTEVIHVRSLRLLLELSREPGAVVPKGTLAARLEPLGDPLDFTAVEVHLSNLRRRIGAQRIRTVRGVGYMLVS